MITAITWWFFYRQIFIGEEKDSLKLFCFLLINALAVLTDLGIIRRLWV